MTSYRLTYLDSPADIDWLRSTHCPAIPAGIRYAVLHGNEDSPVRVECFASEPMIDDKPDYDWRDSHDPGEATDDSGTAG